MSYVGRAVIWGFEADKKPHLHIVLSDPTPTADAILVCICTRKSVHSPSLTIPADTVLTSPRAKQFRTSRESVVDPYFTRLLKQPQLDAVLEQGTDCGTTLADALKVICQAAYADRHECPTMAEKFAIEDAAEAWIASGLIQ